MNKTDLWGCDYTWNPIAMRCRRVSEGCEHCWHLSFANRHGNNLRLGVDERKAYRGNGVVLRSEELLAPMRVRKPSKIIVQLMGDLFDDRLGMVDYLQIFDVMASATRECNHRSPRQCDLECFTGDSHTFLLLTKRPERMREVLADLPHAADNEMSGDAAICASMETGNWPLPNVWLGVTAENQQRADERIPILLSTPAAVRFVSVEPMLGPVNLTGYNGMGSWLEVDPREGRFACVTTESSDAKYLMPDRPLLDWVICGAETGPGARPCKRAWIAGLRDQCEEAGTPFFLKQIDAKHTRDLCGVHYEQMPVTDSTAATGRSGK